MKYIKTLSLFCLSFCILAECSYSVAQVKKQTDLTTGLFEKPNLVAWCIVPFDKQKRGPAERAAMLQKLGIMQLAYDYRKEHIPTFDDELTELKKHGIKLTAWWFPATLNAEAKMTLELFKRHNVHPQLWITGRGKDTKSEKEQQENIEAEVKRLKPIAVAAKETGCQVALYNHGGWFGNPRNQIAIIKKLNMPNVGIVYNLHHGHEHLENFPALLKEMKPYLLTLNLNGMIKNGDKLGKKILPIGAGDQDIRILKIIQKSGWQGPIGILNHTNEDAELRLKDNLNGLKYIVNQIHNNKSSLKKSSPPKYLTYPIKKSKPNLNASNKKNIPGFIAKGRKEYQYRPVTIECRVKLSNSKSYNILLANDRKSSRNHWEIFSLPGSGNLTVYLPGKNPDHIHSSKSITNNQWHTITMQYGLDRVRLFVDQKQVSDSPIQSDVGISKPEYFAIGRLVEGKFYSAGVIDWVHLKKGIHPPDQSAKPILTNETVALWRIGDSDLKKPIMDESPLKNHAKRTEKSHPEKPQPQSPMPPEGVHHELKDKRLQATLIDRSKEDVFMAVKVDCENRIFVGGSEAVFVYEPDNKGGFQPKKRLRPFPPNSIIIGLEFRGDDLYVLTDHALYLIPDGRIKRKNLSVKRILWGVPLDLHVSFHCMAWGPDGKLYLNHGDPLLGFGDWNRPDHWAHWTLHTQPEGTTVPYTGAGAVLRINPDGSNLKVISRGYRGPVGLVFDNNWNLFTNDNDHESRPDQYAPIRLLHVTPHSDFFWPRGWMKEKSPDRYDLLKTMNPSLGRGVPCDMIYYAEDYLPAEYRNQLFLCRWGRFSVNSYQLSPRGASFSAKESLFLKGNHNARPTGIAIGPDGRIYVTSLYLAGNVSAPHCPTDLISITLKNRLPNKNSLFNITKAAENKLYSELNQPSLYRRNQAHQELIRRGDSSLNQALSLLKKTKNSSAAYPHLLWLSAANQNQESKLYLTSLTVHPQKNIRWQAYRAINHFYPKETNPLANKMLDDADPQIQLSGITQLIDSPDTPFSIEKIAKFASCDDTYLRQAATMLLAKSKLIPAKDQQQSLQSLVAHPSEDYRLAGILAAGTRLTVPGAHDIPHEKIKLISRKEDVFYKETILFADSDKKINLKDIGRLGSYSSAIKWNTIPHSKEEIDLKNLLIQALKDSNTRNRLQAAYYLSLLNDPAINPLVEKAQNESILEQFAQKTIETIREAWVLGPFPNSPEGFQKSLPPETSAIDLTTEYPNKKIIIKWTKKNNPEGQFKFSENSVSESSHFVYFQFQSSSKTALLLHLKSQNHFRVWHNGKLLTKRFTRPDQSTQYIKLHVFPGSNDILIRFNSQKQAGYSKIQFQSGGNVSVFLPEQLNSNMLAQRLKEAAKAGNSFSLSEEFLTKNWNKEYRTGDLTNGRKLFGTLGCVKCHAISEGQPGGGAPSLTGASKRFTINHLVESILIPSKQIADQFLSSTILTEDGKIVSGLVISETEKKLEILLSDSSRKTILRDEIEERKTSKISTMPAGIIKTPKELQDLLAYLMSKNPTPP